MINANRIVPVQNVDLLLSLYATALKIAQVVVSKISASNPGEFTQTTSGTSVFCDEPVKKFNFGAGVSSAGVLSWRRMTTRDSPSTAYPRPPQAFRLKRTARHSTPQHFRAVHYFRKVGL